MSKASTVYTAIHSEIASLFTTANGYKELSDPVLIENNDELSLGKGYAIHFGSALNTNRQLANKYSIQRDVMITLTRSVFATHKDITTMETIDKALLEDQHLLIKNFCENDNIGVVAVKRDFINDGGIERIIGDTRNFIMIQTFFQIEYLEDLA